MQCTTDPTRTLGLHRCTHKGPGDGTHPRAHTHTHQGPGGSGGGQQPNNDVAIAAFLDPANRALNRPQGPGSKPSVSFGFGRGVATIQGMPVAHARTQEAVARQQQYGLELQGQIALAERRKEQERLSQVGASVRMRVRARVCAGVRKCVCVCVCVCV